MTNEEALTILEKSEQCYTENCPDGVFCDECPWNVKTAEYDEAIKTIKSVLSKQCASTEQADHIAEPDKMVKLKKRTITERLIIAESLINSVIADSDQFREATKKTEDVPDTNVEKMPYKKPEIIHCGDCRWYEKSHYCGANYPAPDDFCSWAERRNDG